MRCGVVLWCALVAVRFLWVLAPQTGYIHPDEFFQTVEVAAGWKPRRFRSFVVFIISCKLCDLRIFMGKYDAPRLPALASMM